MTKKLYTQNDKYRPSNISKKTSPNRSEFRRDYARLLHSPSFRRLQGKTQLFPGHESDFFRNRLTHSLEVAQIAKSIALTLNDSNEYLQQYPIDTDLVEFAALAHDLGHPPFGHNGETALDDCMRRNGGFEGNAQTLRLLSVIEKKETTDRGLIGINADGLDLRLGLNLTFRSLAAVLKYDKPIPQNRSPQDDLVKGYYQSESELVKNIKTNVAPEMESSTEFKTIECQIMDLADDIAYSTYDLEDGLKSGFVSPLSLLKTMREDSALLERVTEKAQKECPEITTDLALEALANVFGLELDGRPKENSSATPLDMFTWSGLFASNGYMRARLTSSLIDQYIRAISIKINSNSPALSKLILDSKIRMQIEVLKHLNFENTIMSPRLKLVEFRGYDIVSTIFEALTRENGHLLLPTDVQCNFINLKFEDDQKRVICDFVAGMTDRYAIEFFGRLKQGDQSIFKPF